MTLQALFDRITAASLTMTATESSRLQHALEAVLSIAAPSECPPAYERSTEAPRSGCARSDQSSNLLSSGCSQAEPSSPKLDLAASDASQALKGERDSLDLQPQPSDHFISITGQTATEILNPAGAIAEPIPPEVERFVKALTWRIATEPASHGDFYGKLCSSLHLCRHIGGDVEMERLNQLLLTEGLSSAVNDPRGAHDAPH